MKISLKCEGLVAIVQMTLASTPDVSIELRSDSTVPGVLAVTFPDFARTDTVW